MGIIKAIGSAISGGLADQWLEVFEADDMGGTDRLYEWCADPERTEYQGDEQYGEQWLRDSRV